MGWLREFMSHSGLRSFGEVARSALSHPAWPEDTRAQPRSLEAILGRLDRGEDLDWLIDRPGVQQVLASLLQVSVAEIRSVVLDAAPPRPTVGRLRFDDLRAARGMELAQEPLPPTIPDRVALPATWNRCAWVGGPGSGFGLVSRWLTARGLAQASFVEDADQLEQLPTSGPPLYLELDPHLVRTFLERWTGTQPLCLALSLAEPSSGPLAGSGFDILHSVPIEQRLDQVVDWILFRVGGRPKAQRDRLLQWLRREPLAWGLVETLGDTMGLVGACLDGGIDPASTTTKESLLMQWVAHRSHDLARERHRDLLAMRELLPQVLVDMAQSVLIDDTRSLLAPRRIDDWLALVPEQHRRGPDIEWLTVQLVSENLPMRKPDLERAAQRLPPGAHRLIVAMRELLLLRPVTPTRFAVRPHFVARLLQAIAKERLANSTPLFFGEALLRPPARATLLPSLAHRAVAQPEDLAEVLLEQVDLENPALVAAFETGAELIGLAALQGTDVSEAVTAALLEELDALLLFDVEPIPCLRTAIADPAGLADLSGVFYLAVWALSEHARSRRDDRRPELDPWHAPRLPPNWAKLLDCVLAALHAALDTKPPWLAGAVRMLDRLRQAVGANVGPDQHPHDLFRPGLVLDAADLGVLEWSSLEGILEEPRQVNLMMESARVRGIGVEPLSHAAFVAWSEAGRSPKGLIDLQRRLPGLFCHGPAELLAALLLEPDTSLHEETLPALSDSVWGAWAIARQRIDLSREPTAPWQLVPEQAACLALESRPPTTLAVRELVWRRFFDLALRTIDAQRIRFPEIGAAWLQAAPDSLVPRIASHALANGWVGAAEGLTHELARAMVRAVRARVADWRLAYDCLHRLESGRERGL